MSSSKSELSRVFFQERWCVGWLPRRLVRATLLPAELLSIGANLAHDTRWPGPCWFPGSVRRTQGTSER
jgi:hypothetical protein